MPEREQKRTIKQRRPASTPQDGAELHPLDAALLRIAAFLGFPASGVDAAARPEEELSAQKAAARFRLRLRQVMLQGDWWKQDGGPFLAFLEDGQEPVALIPASPGRYKLYRAGSSAGAAVDRALARELLPGAYCPYAPFHSGRIDFRQILRFGLKRFWRRDLSAALLSSAAGGVLGLAIPFFTGILFDYIVPARQLDQLVWIVLLLIASSFASFVFQLTRSVALLRIEGKLDMGLESALWDRILKLPTEFFRDFSAGDLAERAAGITMIRRAVSGVALNAALACVFSLFSLALVFSHSVAAGFAVLLCAAALVAVLTAFFRRLKEPVKLKSLQDGRIKGLLVQLVRGVHKFIITGSEHVAFALWNRPFAQSKELELSIETSAAGLDALLSVFPIVSSIAFYAAAFYGRPAVSTGGFLAMFSAFGAFVSSLVAVSEAFGSLLKVLPLYERIKPVLDCLPEVDESKANPGRLRGNIALSHVVFRYPGGGRNVIDDVSLTIREGEMVALVGGSGSGKSTLLRLLLGFERPLSGSIRYDGMDLNDLDVSEVRNQIGTVIQNAQIMSEDIYKNIIGAANLSIEDAWAAARLVSLDRDIEEMPMGMHTFLSEGGRTLSGGQRQRILLARALVRKPCMMFLDEATSALDNSTQAAVTESLNRLHITRVVIAHRLSTIINADRIVVFDKGRIVQDGTYQDLIARPGPFQELARRQLV